jgi:hypothetical protein
MSKKRKNDKEYYAVFAKAAYEKKPEEVVKKYYGNEWRIDKSLSTSRYQIYTNGQDVIMANRGTHQFEDLVSDYAILQGKVNSDPRFVEARDTYKKLKAKYCGKNVILTGHSLGG